MSRANRVATRIKPLLEEARGSIIGSHLFLRCGEGRWINDVRLARVPPIKGECDDSGEYEQEEVDAAVRGGGVRVSFGGHV